MVSLLDSIEKYIAEKNYKQARESIKEVSESLLSLKDRERYQIIQKKLKPTGMQYSLQFIDGGSFERGSSTGDEDELPIKKVKLDNFYIGITEVTQQQWEGIMGDNPSQSKGNNLPVERVSWYDAVKFCNAASLVDGLDPVYEIKEKQVTCNFKANGYRLPTEAEWEYAARGGRNHNTYPYSGSENIDDVAWYRTGDLSQPQPVGSKMYNSVGLHDMSGNVWEWCWDWYSAAYYSDSSSLNNPTGPKTGTQKTIRGGSWYVNAEFCRVTNRSNRDPEKQLFYDGLRIARSEIKTEGK
jgi:formylglycine-generating enzyme required for sulfatase activity